MRAFSWMIIFFTSHVLSSAKNARRAMHTMYTIASGMHPKVCLLKVDIAIAIEFTVYVVAKGRAKV